MFKKEFFPLFLAIDLQKRAKPSPGLLHTHCNENLSGAETKHFGARPGGRELNAAPQPANKDKGRIPTCTPYFVFV